ncbi:MAG: hypothetical protein KDC61_05165 [Saprospiraceae bacterium]|nr:hypothetical protein [Saprospiraceae bacterium]
MQFNEHQNRLCYDMIGMIEDYRKGKTQYTALVYGLEGALDAGEFNNKVLVEQWYNYWTPLEILSATKGDSATTDDVDKYLSAMDFFLRNQPGFCDQGDGE